MIPPLLLPLRYHLLWAASEQRNMNLDPCPVETLGAALPEARIGTLRFAVGGRGGKMRA